MTSTNSTTSSIFEKEKMSSGTGNTIGVAPDGGHGWIVVIAYSITSILVIPMLQSFGLLFRKIFEELHFTATDISTIIIMNASIGMLLGVWNGPLLKTFGYRKMAIVGSLMTFFGLVLTSRANSFVEFIIFYGILPSYGFVALLGSFGLAQNTYFRKRRCYAAGIGMTLTGIGPIVYPLFISFLLTKYDVRGTALILSAMSLHSLCCAMLLHPIKWHYKKPKNVEEGTILMQENAVKGLSTMPPDLVQSVVDLEAVLQPRRVSCSFSVRGDEVPAAEEDRVEPDDTWWRESHDSVFQSASSIPHLLTTPSLQKRSRHSSRAKSESKSSLAKIDVKEDKLIEEEEEEVEEKQTCFAKVSDTFDLDLLKDPIYVNIWLGLSIAFTGEIIFSLLTPVILGDRNFDINETANIMAVIAGFDLLFRFVAPFVGRWSGLHIRQLYMVALFLLLISRFMLTMVSTYRNTLTVCLFLGMGKGVRSVYMTLVIPNHVPLEKLPSASSLQTVLNGLILILVGPLLGLLRDITGDYNNCIHVINSFTIITLIMWSVELVIVARRKKQNSKTENAEHSTTTADIKNKASS